MFNIIKKNGLRVAVFVDIYEGLGMSTSTRDSWSSKPDTALPSRRVNCAGGDVNASSSPRPKLVVDGLCDGGSVAGGGGASSGGWSRWS